MRLPTLAAAISAFVLAGAPITAFAQSAPPPLPPPPAGASPSTGASSSDADTASPSTDVEETPSPRRRSRGRRPPPADDTGASIGTSSGAASSSGGASGTGSSGAIASGVGASAQTAETPADKPVPEGPPRYDFVRINAGLRVGYVPNAGFDTFATTDVLPQFSLDGTYAFLTKGKLALAAGLGWDIGGRSADTRGQDASLVVHRFSVPIEARYHAATSIYVFGRVAPGAALMLASVKDASAPGDLKDSAWAFSTDLSLGTSILLGPRKNFDRRSPKIWVTPEIGYALTTSASLSPTPSRDADDVLGADASTNLRSVGLSGLFWRASLAATF